MNAMKRRRRAPHGIAVPIIGGLVACVALREGYTFLGHSSPQSSRIRQSSKVALAAQAEDEADKFEPLYGTGSEDWLLRSVRNALGGSEDDMQKELSVEKKNNEKLKEQLVDEREALIIEKGKVEKAMSDNEQFIVRAQELEAHLETERKTAELLSSKVQTLESDLEKEKAVRPEDFQSEDMRIRLEELENDLASEREKVEQLTSMEADVLVERVNTQALQKLELVEDELEVEKAKTSSLEDDLEAERAKTVEQEERAILAEKRVEELSAEVLELQGVMDGSSEAVKKLQDQLSSLQVKFQRAVKVATELSSKVSAMQEEYFTAIEKLDVKEDAQAQLANERLLMMEELTKRDHDVLSLQSDIQDRTAELEDAQEKLGSVRGSLKCAMEAWVTKAKGLFGVERNGVVSNSQGVTALNPPSPAPPPIRE